jgi:SPW repeat
MATDPQTERERAARRDPAMTDDTARGRFARQDAPRYAEPEPAPPAADWRTTVATASGLNLLAGIWLIIAPFVLGYDNGDPYWNDIVFGAIVGFFALIRMSGAYREEWLSYLNALIGIWIFVSAFWLDATSTAGWNDIILGAIVFILALISATARGDVAYTARPWYRR